MLSFENKELVFVVIHCPCLDYLTVHLDASTKEAAVSDGNFQSKLCQCCSTSLS